MPSSARTGSTFTHCIPPVSSITTPAAKAAVRSAGTDRCSSKIMPTPSSAAPAINEKEGWSHIARHCAIIPENPMTANGRFMSNPPSVFAILPLT